MMSEWGEDDGRCLLALSSNASEENVLLMPFFETHFRLMGTREQQIESFSTSSEPFFKMKSVRVFKF